MNGTHVVYIGGYISKIILLSHFVYEHLFSIIICLFIYLLFVCLFIYLFCLFISILREKPFDIGFLFLSFPAFISRFLVTRYREELIQISAQTR